MIIIKKFWPVIFIFLIWFIFSSPYFIKNKVPYASTYQVNFFSPWNTYPQFHGPVKNNAMSDVINQIYPWKHFTVQAFKSGQIPLWNPYSFSGTPHLANYQSAVLSPFNTLFFILPFIDAWSILVLLQPLLAGIFMYLLMQSLNVKKWGSLIASIAFMFCGFITTWMGYATLGYSILFLPLAIFSIEKFYSVNKIRYLFLLLLTIPLSFFSGHFQISLYFFISLAFYLIFKFYQTRNIRNTLYVILYTFLGILLSLPQLLPSIELYSQTLRSGLFKTTEAIPWGYLSTFIAPDFLGNPVTRNDWFGHYAEWNAYIGLIPLMLAFYSIMNKKITRTVIFIFLGVLAILLAFKTPFVDLLIVSHFPVLSTSAASRIIVLFSFSFAVLSGFGFEYLIEDIQKKKIKKIASWLAGFAVVFLSLWFIILFKLVLPIDKIAIAKQNLILPTAIFLAFAGLIIGLFIRKVKYSLILNFISLIIVVLVAFDLLRFATKWQAFDPKNLAFIDIPATLEFKKISDYQRVIGNYGGEVAVYYGLSSVEGYDAVYIKRYGEFIAYLSGINVTKFPKSILIFPRDGFHTFQAANLLNIKYVVYKVADGHLPWTFSFWNDKEGEYKLLYNDGNYQILENTKAFPRAFLVNKYKVVQDSQKTLDTMLNNSFDLRNSIVLDKNPGLVSSAGFKGEASVSQYTPNQVIIKTKANKNSLLFLSDAFYPGWRAYVDDKPSEIYLADYAFRAVVVPAGNHTVKFFYEPLSFEIGFLAAVLGVFSSLIFCVYLLRSRKLLF